MEERRCGIWSTTPGEAIPPKDPATLRTREAVGLSSADQEALQSLRVFERTLENRDLLCRQGDTATHCTILLTGFLARHKIIGEREQIICFHAPGDFADLQTLQLPVLDHDVVSIGTSRVGQVSHVQLQAILDASPKLAHIFWRETSRRQRFSVSGSAT
jgi:CRP-like cAMP-binding protein